MAVTAHPLIWITVTAHPLIWITVTALQLNWASVHVIPMISSLPHAVWKPHKKSMKKPWTVPSHAQPEPTAWVSSAPPHAPHPNPFHSSTQATATSLDSIQATTVTIRVTSQLLKPVWDCRSQKASPKPRWSQMWSERITAARNKRWD